VDAEQLTVAEVLGEEIRVVPNADVRVEVEYVDKEGIEVECHVAAKGDSRE
jgi:hypothetical protein